LHGNEALEIEVVDDIRLNNRSPAY
jgi:hypothetical protein